MREQLVLGNWKMHGSIAMLKSFRKFYRHNDCAQIGICVPAVYMHKARNLFADNSLLLGAQDVSEHAQGAYTGCIAATMLAEIGCDFCLIGHSERRQYQHENSQQIAAKIEQLNASGIRPVLCVGENLQQRKENMTVDLVISQIRPCLDALSVATNPVIAYEPIWAIGTGQTASDQQAQQVHEQIRVFLNAQNAGLSDMPILYGGSVSPENSVGLMMQEDIDGALVGGSSLQAESLHSIACSLAARSDRTIKTGEGF